MHYPLITLLTFSADDLSPINLTERDMQRICLREFLKPRSMGCKSLLLYFEPDRVGNNGQDENFQTDECKWNGVVCENDRMVRMKVNLFQRDPAVVDIDWLQRSIQWLRFNQVTLKNGWVAETLPRDLRFFYMNSYRQSTIDGEVPRDMHFQCLPPNMVEMFSLNSPVHGIVCIDNLPSTMRILLISAHSVEEAWVSYESLPESMELLTLHCSKLKKRMRIRALGNVKADDRLKKDLVLPRQLGLNPPSSFRV